MGKPSQVLVSGKMWQVVVQGEVPAGMDDAELERLLSTVALPLVLIGTVRVVQAGVAPTGPQKVGAP